MNKLIRTFFALILSLILLSACSRGETTSPTYPTQGQNTSSNSALTTESSAVTTTPRSPVLDIEAVADKSSYLPGEIIKVNLTVMNVSKDDLAIDNFPPQTKISQWNNGVVRTLNQGNESKSLKPGVTLTYQIQWDQLDDNGNQVKPSVYSFAPMFPFEMKSSSSNQEGRLIQFPVSIQFAQGTMNKTIDVNRSETVNGATITLNKIEFTEAEMLVYTVKTPPITAGVGPDYYISGQTTFRGTYSFDNGAVQDIGQPGYFSTDSGVKYTWSFLPVPADVKELHFSISRMSIPATVSIPDSDGVPVEGAGDYGPFEFDVPLQ